MTARRLASLGLIAIALLGVGAATLWMIAPRPASVPAAAPLGGPFELVDQDGRTVTDATYRGKWLIVFFGYTHCPDVCPTALNTVALAMDQAGARRDRVQPIFITVDPARDTPAILKEYVDLFGAGIVGLTGTPAQVAHAARSYRIYYRRHDLPDGDYAMAHSTFIYLMDPQGQFVAHFNHETPPEHIAARLAQLIP
jgi:protein SCO1/2